MIETTDTVAIMEQGWSNPIFCIDPTSMFEEGWNSFELIEWSWSDNQLIWNEMAPRELRINRELRQDETKKKKQSTKKQKNVQNHKNTKT